MISKTSLGCLGVLGIVGVLSIVAVLWVFSIFNGEVVKKNTFLAQKKHVETGHDTMWKTISQEYQIEEDYRDTFLKGIQALSAGREGGSLFRSQTEANTQLGLPTDVFNRMMVTIDGKRAMLKREQDTLADMWREHKTYCETMPNSFFVGNRVLPEPIMITSSRTQDSVTTGVDDDISLK